MDSLIALSADYYWEQDAEGRFTQFQATQTPARLHPQTLQSALGKASWDIPGFAAGTASWETMRGTFARRASFRDVEWSWRTDAADMCLLSVCGEPVLDGRGAFLGYRGTMRDITAQKRREGALRRFRAAMDACGDPAFLTDRETMCFIDMNQDACLVTDYPHDELLTMGPRDLQGSDRQAAELAHGKAIASGPSGTACEGTIHPKNGNGYVFEGQRRAIPSEESWTVASIAGNITSRKQTENAVARLARMYAAISGTNEAILYAQTPEQLYQEVCEVAVRGGQIVNASILLPAPKSAGVKVAAVVGAGADTLRSLCISFDASIPEGQGLVSTAFRTRKVCVNNDFARDDRVCALREASKKEGAVAGAVIPLIRTEQSVGVLLLYSRNKGAFDTEVMQLLERMARNIVFALDNFDRERERQQALDALRTSEEKYRNTLENMYDGYFELDLKGSYTFVNEALCRMIRGTREQVLGLNYRDYMDDQTAELAYKVFSEVYASGKAGELAEYPVYRLDGSRCIAQTAVQLIVDAAGTPVGFRGISRDVTAQRVADKALRASEAKYRSILENIQEAYYEVDLAGNLLLCNDAFCRMFGYTMKEILGLHYSRYHKPGDAAYVFEQFNQVFQTGITKTGIEWHLLHKDGNTLLCEGSIHLVTNADGKPVGFRGILRNVTARREMEAALRASEERFRNLTTLSSDWYWEQDEHYRFVQINGDVLVKTGMDKAAFLGKTLWEMPFEQLSHDQWAEHRSYLSGNGPFCELVLKTGSAQGAPRYISISGLPLRDAEGRLLGYHGIGKDITERKLAEERIRYLAVHDILTGLPNRMMFNQMLSHQVQQARRYDRKFGLMFIDLDHFKEVNDNFGHDAGDVLLKEIARRLTEGVRASDFVARLAGDEFVVIIQELDDPGQLNVIASKVVAAVRPPVSIAGTVHQVTASVGVCVFPDDGDNEDALLMHADIAMYEVKRLTKDGFRFYIRSD
jgi:diguanylate cyclase (GGDEF)-like protein/PAS domain S-box-containing protein